MLTYSLPKMSRRSPLYQVQYNWQRLPAESRGRIVLALPIACLLVSLAAYTGMRQSVIHAQRSVDNTQAVLLQSHQLMITLLNAETGVRGYTNTRQLTYLEPYNAALMTLPSTLQQLSSLVKDNPQQSQRLSRIRDLANQKLLILQQIVKWSKVTPAEISPATQDLSLLSESKQVMDAFRDAVTQFEVEENQILSGHRRRLEYQWTFTNAMIWGSALISLLGGAISIALFNDLARELRDRDVSLRETRTLIQTVFANVVDSIVVLNEWNQVASVNDATVRMFGYPPEKILNQDWMMLLAENTRAQIAESTQTLIQDTAIQVEQPWQTMGKRQQGDLFPIEVSISEIPFHQHHIVIIRDITERQQSAANLQSKAVELAQVNRELSGINHALAERNRELDQFAYVASHDLKAPLRAIINLSEWIEEDLEGQLPAESLKQMQLLRGRVHRMSALLNGLLDYSRVGRTQLPIERVNVNDLLREVIDTIAPPKTFTIEIAPNLPTLSTRQVLLKQVFTNLIDNAIKHHPTATGTIRITFTDLSDRCEFAVTDDGKGIDPKFHDKIFTIFQTLEARDHHESTGIGLAIVKKIVETEGGTLRLISQIGQGSTFYFTWLKSAK